MKGKSQNRGLGGIASRRRDAVRVKAKSQRSESSRQWLLRQLNDPYVAAAKDEGYRSRAAFKLLQLDEKFHFLKNDMRVVDLGAAPGGWSQVVAQKLAGRGKIIALDLLPIKPIEGAECLEMDFLSDDAPERIKELLNGPADLVLSDMAPSTTGHARTDHIRIMTLAEAAALLAHDVLAPGGTFVCKFFLGGAEKELLDRLKQDFKTVRHAKPPASRAESSETYLVAQGFRSNKK
ncbi:MAG: RlmE family RNA methyltransferase [Bdellovibrionales bacterium]